MRCVIAPDKFKGSLTAGQVVEHLTTGIRSVDPDAQIVAIPVADGGEGTLDAAVGAGFVRQTALVSGPTGRRIEAEFAVRGSEAVIELARASGLDVLTDGVKDALGAGTRGTGELILAALDLGCDRIILGIGGSASTDGGAGILQALGVRLLDADQNELAGGGAALARLARIDLSGLDARVPATEFILSSDVDNPLLGATGAAAIFGPQKGATPNNITMLDAALSRFARMLVDQLAINGNDVTTASGVTAANTVTAVTAIAAAASAPGSGAAGGAGFAALTVLDAVRRPGIELVLELTRFAAQLAGADFVITGEGSLDEQSLSGKTPVGVAALANAHGVPVYAVCGRTTLDQERLRTAGFKQTFTLTDLEPDLPTCMREAGALLERIGRLIARQYLDARHHSTGSYDLVLLASRIVTPDGIVAGEVGVRDGSIVTIAAAASGLQGTSIVRLADDEILIPGLVDTHVHVNEPGRTEWEGFASATRAAAAGGVTTIIDMPLNSIPPTTSVEALEIKRAVATGQIFVDVGFWGGAIPGNRESLHPLYDSGVFGFKSFLIDSGVDEFPALSADELEADLTELAAFDAQMIVHAEDADVIAHSSQRSGTSYQDFLASRPPEAENAAIAQVITSARTTGARVHILHLSSAGALELIAAARRDGVAITVETCPHYLTLIAEEIPDGATAYKCCPPIRGAANRDRLWEGLKAGIIDFIVSDHSPSTREIKEPAGGDFAEAWGGISSLQLGLALIWTEARTRDISLERVVGWMSAGPAALAGLNRKGRIAIGADADFAIFAPEQTFVVDAAALEHKNPVTAYNGRSLSGVVRATYLRGTVIDGRTATGELIRRDIR